MERWLPGLTQQVQDGGRGALRPGSNRQLSRRPFPGPHRSQAPRGQQAVPGRQHPPASPRAAQCPRASRAGDRPGLSRPRGLRCPARFRRRIPDAPDRHRHRRHGPGQQPARLAAGGRLRPARTAATAYLDQIHDRRVRAAPRASGPRPDPARRVRRRSPGPDPGRLPRGVREAAAPVRGSRRQRTGGGHLHLPSGGQPTPGLRRRPAPPRAW
jgi:hypothetical protein